MGARADTLFAAGFVLPKSRLAAGEYYIGLCRNAQIARWDGTQFHHWRRKFGARFVETIKHREDETHFDVFDPLAHIEDLASVAEVPFALT